MLRYVVRAVLLTSVFLVARNAAYAQCPKTDVEHGIYASEVYQDGVIAFVHTNNPDYPLNVLLYRRENSCEGMLVDKYSTEGSPPKIKYVFGQEYRGKKLLFVIVVWKINSRGAGVYGDLYQVYAYEKDGNGGLKVDQDIVSRNDMSGIDGVGEDKPIHFQGKTPSEVEKLLGLGSHH